MLKTADFFAKVDLRFDQYQIDAQTNGQRLWTFCQSGEILPNLDTLVGGHLTHLSVVEGCSTAYWIKMYFNRPSQKHASNTALVKHHLGRIMVWPPLIERSWVWIPVADEIFQFLKNIFWKGRKINITIHFVTVSSKCVFLKRVIPCLFLLIFTLSHNNKISNFTTSKCEQWSI